MNKFSQWS
jgi:serine/threonine protein kinase